QHAGEKSSSPQLPRQCRNNVRFPPSPTLTRTFSAYSPSSYDRSPIVVLPNVCALPARGCPGRTYVPGSSPSTSPNAPLDARSREAVMKAKGQHFHPRRALGLGLASDPTAPERAINSSVAPPPLVPDLSSESDESDGFTSPPSEYDPNAKAANPLLFLPFASMANLNLGSGIYRSPDPQDEDQYQYHSYEEEKRRRRERDRDRGKGDREQRARQRAHDRDMGARDLERKTADGTFGEEDLEDGEDADDDDLAERRYKRMMMAALVASERPSV
ncbi:hypothetical protein BC834DRAFT_856780, partial [Gloeopeniophorella convolvens]